MTEEKTAVLLDDIKNNLLKIKEYRDMGIPVRKLREYTLPVKNDLKEWIRDQRSQNISYQKIEAKLHAEGVLTLSGKRKWDPRTICKIERGRY
jgi:hypothetical protein